MGEGAVDLTLLDVEILEPELQAAQKPQHQGLHPVDRARREGERLAVQRDLDALEQVARGLDVRAPPLGAGVMLPVGHPEARLGRLDEGLELLLEPGLGQDPLDQMLPPEIAVLPVGRFLRVELADRPVAVEGARIEQGDEGQDVAAAVRHRGHEGAGEVGADLLGQRVGLLAAIGQRDIEIERDAEPPQTGGELGPEIGIIDMHRHRIGRGLAPVLEADLRHAAGGKRHDLGQLLGQALLGMAHADIMQEGRHAGLRHVGMIAQIGLGREVRVRPVAQLLAIGDVVFLGIFQVDRVQPRIGPPIIGPVEKPAFPDCAEIAALLARQDQDPGKSAQTVKFQHVRLQMNGRYLTTT